MAEIKVSQLPEATQINDNDLIMIVQSGTNKKITKENCQFASGDEIYVGDTEPSGGYDESVKLLIEPSEDSIDAEGTYITNEYSVAQDKGYSCNYFNNANAYSTTDEIDTGKRWIDGKKIYRKVLDGTTPSSAGSWGNVGSLTYAKLISLTGILGNYLPAPCYINSSYYCALQCSGSNVQVYVQGYTSNPIKVIAEYTKD